MGILTNRRLTHRPDVLVLTAMWPLAAYGFGVYLDGGDEVTLRQRERPQVVIERGAIVALFNGARGTPSINGGRTFSMVTEVCGNGGVAVGGVCPTQYPA